MLQIDIGCGPYKRAGHVGVDIESLPGVDYVADVGKGPLPFDDNSIDGAFTSHFLEHILYPEHVLREIVRVCKHGSKVEIWTPYSKHSLAFIGGHISFFNEMRWSQFCIEFPDFWFPMPGALRLDTFQYCIPLMTINSLEKVPLHFAIRHFNDVVQDFGVRATVLKGEEYLNKSEFKKQLELPELRVGVHRDQSVPLDAPRDFWVAKH